MNRDEEVSRRLALFPVSFFSVTMGLGGLALATRTMESVLGLPGWISWGVLGVDIAVFSVLLFAYAAKIFLYPKHVLRELRHPVTMNFAPTVSIGMLLISTALLEGVPGVSRTLWFAGTALQLILSLAIMREWVIQDHFEIIHMSPAWFIPVVGNIVVPLAGMAVAPRDVSWFFFSAGIVMWGALLAIVLSRAIFHRSLPDRLLPTFFILVAPPSVGFIVFVKLMGGLDPLGRILFFFAAFVFLFLITLTRRFLSIRFYLSWWAYSFPLAAFTLATALMAGLTQSAFYRALSVFLWAALVMIVAVLAVKTLGAVSRREICVED